MPTQEPVPGVKIGATGNFLATPVDASGNAVPLEPGTIVPTWTASAAQIVLTQSADGLTVSAAVPASLDISQVPSFVLALQGTRIDGTNITGTVTVTVLPADVVAVPVSFVITQTS